MGNGWKEIWEKRKVDEGKLALGKEEAFLEMKRCDGFDVVGGSLAYKELMKQYHDINKKIGRRVGAFDSVYEIGCGAGANLFLYEGDGILCGGVDYSKEQIRVAKKVLKSDDVTCAEAVDMLENPQYDIILSNSVFSYFPSEEYALEVLERAYGKCGKAIVLIDLCDAAQKKNYLRYRKSIIRNYDELYKGLDKLFFDRELFSAFAREHDMDVLFDETGIDGYWNNSFIFNCYMIKK